MTWFRNAWARFFIWVARWFWPPEWDAGLWPLPSPPVEKPRFDADAQDLIALARAVREKRWQQITDPQQVKHITPEEAKRMMAEVEQPPEPVPDVVFRSASFRSLNESLDARAKIERDKRNSKLTLKASR